MNYLSENVVYKEFEDKTILYHEDGLMENLILIFDGIVKQVKHGSKGKELVIRFAKSGEILGFLSVLTNELACTTTETKGAVKVGFIKNDCLLKIMRSNTNFAFKLIQHACYELEETQRFILNVAQKQIRERVADVLIQLKDIFDIEEDNTIKTIISRKEMASVAGTEPEWL